MSFPVLPSSITLKSQRASWGLRVDNPNRRTEMDNGEISVSRRLARARVVNAVTAELTEMQFELFKDFWLKDLRQGSQWFLAPIHTGMDTSNKICRFASDPPFSVAAGAPGFYMVTIELEMKELPTLSAHRRIAMDIYVTDRTIAETILPRLTAIRDQIALELWP